MAEILKLRNDLKDINTIRELQSLRDAIAQATAPPRTSGSLNYATDPFLPPTQTSAFRTLSSRSPYSLLLSQPHRLLEYTSDPFTQTTAPLRTCGSRTLEQPAFPLPPYNRPFTPTTPYLQSQLLDRPTPLKAPSSPIRALEPAERQWQLFTE